MPALPYPHPAPSAILLRRPLLGAFSTALVLSVLAVPSTPLAAQDAPRVTPGEVELAADGDRAQVELLGPTVEAFSGVRVVDQGGFEATGLRVEFGAAKGDLRVLTLSTNGAAAGVYGVLLDGAKGPVEVGLRITVAAAPTLSPPEIVNAGAPASVETGAALTVGVLVRSSASLVAVEWTWDDRRNEVKLGGGTEAKEEIRLDAPMGPGPSTIRLVAVDVDGRRSAPRELIVDIVAPPPIPRIEELRLEPSAVAGGDTPTLRLRLDVPAPEPLEIALAGQGLSNGVYVGPPPTVTVPAGVREVEVPVTFTGGYVAPGAHPFTVRAMLDGTEHVAQGSVVGTPFVVFITVPAWVLAEDEATAEIHLSDVAQPGGTEVEVWIPPANPYQNPATVMVVPEGETRLTATTTLEQDQPAPVDVYWSARTAAHAEVEAPPVVASHALHARPRIQALHVFGSWPMSEASRGAFVSLAAPAPPSGVEVALEVVPEGILSVQATVNVLSTNIQSGFQVHLLEAPAQGDVEVVIRATLDGEVTETTVTVAASGGT